ncbi:MAG: hypothetical protein AAF623_03915 [Planctomycetota bacterium]
MATIAIEFEADKIFVAESKQGSRNIEVNHLFSVGISGDDAQASETLKSALSQHGCSRADAIVVISRTNVEMREVQVPPAPADELPDMVRFLAKSEFAAMNDGWAFDFVPLSDNETEARKVIAVAISPEYKKQIESICEGAGVRVKHLVLRPYATVDLLNSRLQDAIPKLIVDPNGDNTDLTVVDGLRLLTTRTVRLPESYDTQQRARNLLSEIKRTIASTRKSLGDRSIEAAMLIGQSEVNQAVSEALDKDLGILSDQISPLDFCQSGSRLGQPANPERYTALLGALSKHHQKGRHTIDFSNPRRPVVKKRDFSKFYIYGALAAVLFLTASGFGYFYLQGLSEEIASYEEDLKALKTQNAGNANRPSAEDLVAEVDKIDSWLTRDVDWLEELYQFSELALTPDDTIVDSFTGQIGKLPPSNVVVDDSNRLEYDHRIFLKMKVADVEKEKELRQSLRSRPYRVSSQRNNKLDDSEDYGLNLDLTTYFAQPKDELVKQADQRADIYIKERTAKLRELQAQNPEESDEGPLPAESPEKS